MYFYAGSSILNTFCSQESIGTLDGYPWLTLHLAFSLTFQSRINIFDQCMVYVLSNCHM